MLFFAFKFISTMCSLSSTPVMLITYIYYAYIITLLIIIIFTFEICVSMEITYETKSIDDDCAITYFITLFCRRLSRKRNSFAVFRLLLDR